MASCATAKTANMPRRATANRYGIWWRTHEKLALITLGVLFNRISQSEFDDGVAPTLTSAAYEIGQRCRKERLFDCYQKREVDIARELLSRNRSAHASRRAEELAEQLEDDEEWAKTYRSLHLGDKLISLAVRFAEFDGQPIFEFQTVRESDTLRSASATARSLKRPTKTTQRIAFTEAAGDWIADQSDESLRRENELAVARVVSEQRARRERLSVSGGNLLSAAFQFLAELLPTPTESPESKAPANALTSTLKQSLNDLVEQGRIRSEPRSGATI
jgi:hypothetical protein